MNSLENIFSKVNMDILRILFEHNSHLRDLARKSGCSPAKVSQALKVFESFGFVSYKQDLGKKIISLNRSNALLKNIKRLDNIQRLLSSNALKKIFESGLAGVFGSFAEGSDIVDSDIDLWVFLNGANKNMIKKKKNKIKGLKRDLEKEIGKEINLIFIDKEKINSVRTADAELFYRIKLTSVPLNCNLGDVFD